MAQLSVITSVSEIFCGRFGSTCTKTEIFMCYCFLGFQGKSLLCFFILHFLFLSQVGLFEQQKTISGKRPLVSVVVTLVDGVSLYHLVIFCIVVAV